MRFVKSLLVGVLAGTVTSVVVLVATAAIGYRRLSAVSPRGTGGIGLDVISVPIWPAIAGGLIALIAGVAWHARRTARKA